jgi:hypothetical protein
MKRTDTTNADTVRIQGSLSLADLAAGTLVTIPYHRFATVGSNVAYSNAAANHTVVRGSPAPAFRPEMVIATSVPAQFFGTLWALYRNR